MLIRLSEVAGEESEETWTLLFVRFRGQICFEKVGSGQIIFDQRLCGQKLVATFLAIWPNLKTKVSAKFVKKYIE